MKLDAGELRSWIGRRETAEDVVTAFPPQALAATLDLPASSPADGDPLPPLWHWLYFLPLHRHSELGPDGHAQRGGFLPPIPLPRRMWAGGALSFERPLRVGQRIRRVSTVADVAVKAGRSGDLAFVAVDHEVFAEDALAVRERQDIVYRDAAPASAEGRAEKPRAPLPHGAEWTHVIDPLEVLLFRYSALTFNGHRIHYDRRYATEVEGYPGLIVHGPLIATLLAELARASVAQPLRTFEYRAVAPVFDRAGPFRVNGRRDGDGALALWAETADGHLAMQANATLA